MLRVATLLAAAAAADGFCAQPLLFKPVGGAAVAVAVRGAPHGLLAARGPGRLALRSADGMIKVEGGKAGERGACPQPCMQRRRTVVMCLRCGADDEEQCDGPATSGEVGNVDMSAAKVSATEIKTDGIINLTPQAVAQITSLRKSRGEDEVVMRVGVRAGGCSGMSYVMEFEDAGKVAATDTEIKFDGFRVVVDPKSLMFVYGMTLNYRFNTRRMRACATADSHLLARRKNPLLACVAG
jgi:iron-sulfur cluster assembly protein